VKIGLKHANPLFFAGTRFILAGIMLLPFCGRPVTFIKNIYANIKLVLMVSLFQTFLLYGAFFFGMNLVPGAIGAIIIGASPLVTAIMSHFHMKDDKLEFSKMISISMGIVGVIIISLSTKPWVYSGFRQLLGIMILLSGSLCSAMGNILVARDNKKINPVHLNAAQIFLGGILLFIFSLIFEGAGNFNVPLEFYLMLFWLAFVSASAFSFWFILLKMPETKVSELNIWKFIIPVFGAVFSWIILPDESPSLSMLTGMMFIVFALVHSNYRNIKRAQ
jgi:drug/metabolite transporter (DMT)-like permease